MRVVCMLIDVAIPGDRNVIQKEAENILKYKDLTIEIQRMWNVKTVPRTSNLSYCVTRKAWRRRLLTPEAKRCCK
jgi:hypothetical protein